MVSTDIVTPPKDPMKAFEERVIEKIKADIGAMLPDEVLNGLAKKAIDEQFFKDKILNPNRANYEQPRYEASSFVQEITKAATPILKKIVQDFVANNEDKIRKALEKFLTEQNLLLILIAEMRNESTEQLRELQQDLEEFKKQVKGS